MGACVHIVIVNWNTGGYLGQCLQSVALAERPEVTISRVTVVDNASSDGSTRALGDLSLPIELIRNSRNIGFAAACNQAAADSTVATNSTCCAGHERWRCWTCSVTARPGTHASWPGRHSAHVLVGVRVTCSENRSLCGRNETKVLARLVLRVKT